MEERPRYDASGRLSPPGTVVRIADPKPVLSPRDCAILFAYSATQQNELAEHGLVIHRDKLPVSPDEMADLLNVLIDAAGDELDWLMPTEDGVPPDVRRAQQIVQDALRRAGFMNDDVEVRRVDGVIPHQPDGDPHPAQDGREAQAQRDREERARYMRLASTVLDALRRIYRAVADEELDEQMESEVMHSVRTMAGAIGEGALVTAVDQWLTGHGYSGGPEGVEYDQAARFARAILNAQIRDGEASVNWDSRGASREARIATAELILRASRVGAAVGYPVASTEWIEAVTGALMSEQGCPPSTASRIAKTAQGILEMRPDWYTHPEQLGGVTAAEAS